jgi:hypothetical protein
MVTNRNPNGNKRVRINLSVNEQQAKLFDSLIGEMGNDRTDVVKNIVIAWLSEKNIIPNIIREKNKQKND